ncbi:MAG: hypothetical protein DRH89_03670 [Candidatus Cloacimonadota bacterium]|nr:MAG: hypothetical protein DRH89_03670 [Candidatus Cloacimonadota bacterium]
MNIGIRTVGIIIIISLIVISCTQKDNLVGTGGSGEQTPLNITIDHNFFTDMYSYEDSCAYSNSNTMVLGKYNEETSYSLLRFTTLPDTSVEITSVNISLEIKNRNNFDIVDNTTLKLAKINDIEWFENATWWISSDSTDWNNGEHFSETDYTNLLPEEYEIECEEDSINIILNTNILEDWINEDVNSGLVIYSDTGGFMEIYASEYSSDGNPILSFEYRETEEDTLITKTIETCYDCMIYETDNDYEKWENELKISNIQPVNIFTKFEVPDSLFTNAVIQNGHTIEDSTALFLQRITINRAELVLNNDGVNSYPISGSIYLNPYFVTADTINTDPANLEIPLLSYEDINDLYISSSTDTLQSEKIHIDITKIIQYYISGEYENKGIVLRSLNVNDNFIHTEFDLEPEIQIIFTPPYIEE